VWRICTDTIAGWGILFHPICFGIRLRPHSDADVPGHQQYLESSNRPLLHDGSDIQSWHVPRLGVLPPVEFRHVYHVFGHVNVHELEGWTEDCTRDILLCSWWSPGMAIFDGSMCSVLGRGDCVRISQR